MVLAHLPVYDFNDLPYADCASLDMALAHCRSHAAARNRTGGVGGAGGSIANTRIGGWDQSGSLLLRVRSRQLWTDCLDEMVSLCDEAAARATLKRDKTVDLKFLTTRSRQCRTVHPFDDSLFAVCVGSNLRESTGSPVHSRPLRSGRTIVTFSLLFCLVQLCARCHLNGAAFFCLFAGMVIWCVTKKQAGCRALSSSPHLQVSVKVLS